RLIHPGQVLRVQGKVRMFRNVPQMTQAKWELIEPDAPRVGEDLIRAIYPASGRLSSSIIWHTIDRHLQLALQGVDEWFDAELLQRRKLMGRKEAFATIHQPTSWG